MYDDDENWMCLLCGELSCSDSDDYDSEEEQKVVVPPIPPRPVSVEPNLRAREPVRLQTQQMPLVNN
jgi:hypothetical protein